MNVSIWAWPNDCTWPWKLKGYHTHSLRIGTAGLHVYNKPLHLFSVLFFFSNWKEKKNRGFSSRLHWFYSPGPLSDMGEWLAEKDKGGARSKWDDHRSVKRVFWKSGRMTCVCVRAHKCVLGSTTVCIAVCVEARTDRISQKVETSRYQDMSCSAGTHWGLHTRSRHSRPSRRKLFAHFCTQCHIQYRSTYISISRHFWCFRNDCIFA